MSEPVHEQTVVTIYGLMGHAGRIQMPLDALELEELEPGEEFIFNGKVYQIRSVLHRDDEVMINVTLALDQALF